MMPGGATAEDFLDEAREIVKARARAHGDFLDTHARIARLWSAYLSVRREPNAALDASDVLTMLELVKIAREQAGGFNPDDLLDRIGYAAGSAEVRGRMALAGALGESAQAAMVDFTAQAKWNGGGE
jgi:hypothetical protein